MKVPFLCLFHHSLGSLPFPLLCASSDILKIFSIANATVLLAHWNPMSRHNSSKNNFLELNVADQNDLYQWHWNTYYLSCFHDLCTICLLYVGVMLFTLELTQFDCYSISVFTNSLYHKLPHYVYMYAYSTHVCVHVCVFIFLHNIFVCVCLWENVISSSISLLKLVCFFPNSTTWIAFTMLICDCFFFQLKPFNQLHMIYINE